MYRLASLINIGLIASIVPLHAQIKSTDQTMEETIQKTQSTLPKKMNDFETLTKASYGNKIVTFEYDTDFKGDQQRANLYIKNLEKALIKRLCTNPELSLLLSQGISYQYTYHIAQHGTQVIVVDAGKCQVE